MSKEFTIYNVICFFNSYSSVLTDFVGHNWQSGDYCDIWKDNWANASKEHKVMWALIILASRGEL